MEPGGDFRESGNGKIEIFEKSEQRKIHSDGDYEEKLATARIRGAKHSHASEVTDGSGERHQRAEFVIPRSVKNVARDSQPNVALIPCTQPPETEIRDRKKEKQEDEAIKEHLAKSALAGRGWRANHSRPDLSAENDKRNGRELLDER